MESATTSPWAARQSVIDNVLGDDDLESLAMSIVGGMEAEQALILRIGQLYVDSKDSEANDLRDCLYRAQTLRDVCQRVLAEGRQIASER